jgi:hypothetical protein
MSDDIISALIGAASTVAAAGIAACVAVRTIASEIRKNREARRHEQQRDREAHTRELEKERCTRAHELRRGTYGGVVDNSLRQGLSILASRLEISIEKRGPFIDEYVRILRPLMEAHLVASQEAIVALMAAGRNTLARAPLSAYSRPLLVGLYEFSLWTEDQIPLLLELRCDLGFDREEIDPLQRAWKEHLNWQRDWMLRADATLAAQQPPSLNAMTPQDT